MRTTHYTANDLRKELVRVLRGHQLEELVDKLSVKYTDKSKRTVKITLDGVSNDMPVKYEGDWTRYYLCGAREYNDFNYVVADFDYTVCKATVDASEKRERLPYNWEDIIEDYLRTLPAGKCLVFTLDKYDGYYMFLRFKSGGYHSRFESVWRYFDGDGIAWEFNMPCLSRKILILSEENIVKRCDVNGKERYQVVRVPALVPLYFDDECTNNYGVYADSLHDCFIMDGENYSDPFMHHNRHWKISDVSMIDCPDDMSLDEFANKFIEKNHPEFFEDDPEDPELDAAFEALKKEDPEGVEYFQDYFCRKRCNIDRGVGCGSNRCKHASYHFISFNIEDHKRRTAEESN